MRQILDGYTILISLYDSLQFQKFFLSCKHLFLKFDRADIDTKL